MECVKIIPDVADAVLSSWNVLHTAKYGIPIRCLVYTYNKHEMYLKNDNGPELNADIIFVINMQQQGEYDWLRGFFYLHNKPKNILLLLLWRTELTSS